MKFSVSNEIYDEASVETGDAVARGLIATGLRLRDAVEALFGVAGPAIVAVEASSTDFAAAEHVTVIGAADHRTGTSECRALHIPRSATPSSRGRLVRLVVNW